MNIDLDNLEEAKELLEYALENRRWIEVEEALEIIKKNLDMMLMTKSLTQRQKRNKLCG